MKDTFNVMKEKRGTIKPVHCKKVPAVNVLDQKEFNERVRTIFGALDDILGKSFGAYGAPTIISNYPYNSVTKDGYHIALNIIFDHIYGEEIDRVIAGMANDICGRLNYAVGDGTTTAIIATNQIYKSAMELFPNLMDATATDSEVKVRPKDLLNTFTEVKDMIVAELEKRAIHPKLDDMEDIIEKVVRVSSNGDEHITNLIKKAYHEIGSPSIRCEVSDTMDTYMMITKGYHSKVRISERIFVNGEGNRCNLRNADVLVFDHMVKRETYTNIISPLVQYVRFLGRNLICIAPTYDEETVQMIIRRDITEEWKVTKSSTLILSSYPAMNANDKKSIADLAMLLGSTLINRDLEHEILDRLAVDNEAITSILNLNQRGIKDSRIILPSGQIGVDTGVPANEEESKKYLLNIGYADKVTLTDKDSIFELSHYDTEMYKKYLEDAKFELDKVIEKYAILGTYTTDVYNAQYRYTSLSMHNATIFVGGDSATSRDMLRDAVDDAIRAAESAYRSGYIKGCNLTTLQIIRDLKKEFEIKSYKERMDPTRKSLIRSTFDMLENGFRAVYFRVLSNAYPDVYTNKDRRKAIEEVIDHSIETGKVFDLSTFYYDGNDNIINSAKTDIEVLTAVMDLLKMLLIGNQVLLMGYNHEKAEYISE